MPTLNFPNAPTAQEVYTFENNSWNWDGVKWNLQNKGGRGSLALSFLPERYIIVTSPIINAYAFDAT